MLKKPYRIRKNKEFRKVFSGRGLYHCDPFTIKYTKNDLGISRFGFVVSLKVSKLAPKRNTLKRRMREIMRMNIGAVKDSYDIVFIIKKNAINYSYKDLENKVLSALSMSHLLKNK
jgi:ribonuclease P protein component